MIIVLDRELNELDSLVLEFIKCLQSRYVIVAGYVAILLGRSRTTDDIDIIVEAPSGSEIASRLAACGFPGLRPVLKGRPALP